MSYMSLASEDPGDPGHGQNKPLLEEYTDDDEFISQAMKRVKWKQHKKRCLFLILLVGFITLAACVIVVPIILSLDQNPKRQIPKSNSILGLYPHAAVASDVTQCSEIGRSILEKKGSAVDAAIASLFCMGLTDPQSMGVGGGFLMTVYIRKKQSVYIIDGRETAPAAANETMYVGHPELSAKGPLSIAVPGEVMGYWEAHRRFGELSWSDVIKPAVEMATSGFLVPDSMAKALIKDKDTILNDTQLSKVYVNPRTGKLYKVGENMTYPSLGKTLRTLADNPMEFYNGSLMREIVADIKERGGIITEEDMKNYSARVREPTVSRLRSGLRVFGPPPPGSGAVLAYILQILDGSGAVLAYILQILDGYSLSADNLNKETILTYHRIIEAFKFAYAKRTFLGDEDYENVTQLVSDMTSREFADGIRKKIWDNTTHQTSYYGPVWDGRVKTGTAHLSVVAENGDAVSVTSTVNSRFGSKVLGKRTGILFNNEMDDFSTPNETNSFDLRPSPANFIVPGKRPLSSMCPAIVLDPSGKVTMVVGAAGGSRITTTTALVMSFVMWFGENIKEAIDELRLHHQLLPATAYYEDGFSTNDVKSLEKLGHNMTWQEIGKSIVQGIVRVKGGLLEANCDYRKGGSPAGF